MTTVVEKGSTFLADFDRRERALNAGLPPWVHRLRRGAMARFAQMGLPTTRHEEWRFTDISALAETDFEPAPTPTQLPAFEQIEAAGLPRLDGPRLLLINGRCCAELSSTAALPKVVTAAGLAERLHARPALVEPHLGRYADYRDHAFVALNTALFEDGLLLRVPPGAAVEQPIHLVHVATAAERPYVAHPRTLILVGRGARATIVESFVGLGENVYLTNAVTEIVLAEGAVLDHYRLQREGPGAFHVATIQAAQARESSFSSHLISLGSRLARTETNTRLDAEGCHAVLDGLYLARGRQHLDSRTQIDHARPHGTSRELYKGILADQARGVFNGKVLVHPRAQKTDARQTNQALLLSDSAQVNTKPQLEIFADDVRCTHGATVGRLDPEALFYLRSRGLALGAARRLLIFGFANEVVSRVRPEGLRRGLEGLLTAGDGLSDDGGRETTA